MDVFDHRIDLEQQIFAAARPVDGAIVAHAERNLRPPQRQLADLLDHRQFIHTRYPNMSPDGSSSPKILPIAARSAAGSASNSTCGNARRASSSVCPGKSRVLSPVTRASAPTASAAPRTFV